MADYIYTVSKKKFYPLNPNIDDIDINDIAHALSMLSRANGHFPSFHSVAQHSIECANEAIARNLSPKVCLACLLHDASEAYMSDVTTPVKSHMPDYQAYEEKLISLIYSKYVGELSKAEKEIVTKIDKELLYHEFYHYMKVELSEKAELVSRPVFEFKDFGQVKNEYIDLFEKLKSSI